VTLSGEKKILVVVPFAGYRRQLTRKMKYDSATSLESVTTNAWEAGVGLGYHH